MANIIKEVLRDKVEKINEGITTLRAELTPLQVRLKELTRERDVILSKIKKLKDNKSAIRDFLGR